jgi:thiol:disulfide interchange protein DsbD
MKRVLSLVCLSAAIVCAQKKDPVQWTLSSDVVAAPAGTIIPLRFHAAIQPGWHVYSLTIERLETGPMPTRVKVADSPTVASYEIYQPKPLRKVDATIGLDTQMFENSMDLWIPVKLADNAKSGPVEIVAEANYQACDDKQCLRAVTKTSAVAVTVDPAAPVPGAFVIPKGYTDINDKAAVAALTAEKTPSSFGSSDGLAAFALTAFGFGLASIFTPCVFPMIPMTVSFFLRQRGGILQAVVFAAGIAIFLCGLALALTAALGPFGVVQMSSNPWVNGFIALVFFVFALSLLGAFEIALPSSMLTKMDHATRRGGYLGTLLMGLTFSLTSFACVGPFIGPLLVSSVQSASKTGPIVGMASFSIGMASPFFFLAAFPSYLKKLPSSGSWMMRVKVVAGFVLLAVMFKYLSNVDQVLQWGFLTRDRFLAAWVVLFTLAGLYLLGLLRLEGIEPGDHLGIGRLLAGSAFLIFALSLIPGMFGGSLGELEAYVPVAENGGFGKAAGANSGPVWMKDQYREALELAKAENKLVLVNFTGYTCANCHWMKANMFPRPEIAAALDQFVRVELYTDGLEAIAKENQRLQDRYDTVAQPFYVLMKPDETVIATFDRLTRDPQEYLNFLNKRPL